MGNEDTDTDGPTLPPLALPDPDESSGHTEEPDEPDDSGDGKSEGPYPTPIPEPNQDKPAKSVAQLANEVENGLWGSPGFERDSSLRAKGFSPGLVKAELNRRRYQVSG